MNITVEPVLILYMLAFMITNIIEKDLFESLIGVRKYGSYYLNPNFTTEFPLYKEKVLNDLSTFIKYNYIVEYSIVIFCMPFYICFNRAFGSKIMIMLSLLGKMIYVLGILFCINFEKDVNVYILLIGSTVPGSFFGSNILIFANCFNLYAELHKKKIPKITKDSFEIALKNLPVDNVPLVKVNKIQTSKSLDNINNDINKNLNKNTCITLKLLISLIENQARNMELFINNAKNGLVLPNIIKYNIYVVCNNLRIISKIFKLIPTIINNNENLYSYAEIIKCIDTIGINKNDIISSYDEKLIDKIIIKAKTIVYDSVNFEYLNTKKNTEYVTNNCNEVTKQLISLSKLSNKISITQAEYICRHIRNIENILRNTLLNINYMPENDQKIDTTDAIFGHAYRKPNAIRKLIKPPKNDSKAVDYSILHCAYIICIPLGTYLGKVLYSYLQSYTYMYTINLTLLYFAFIYTGLRFKLDIREYESLFDFKYIKKALTFGYKEKKKVAIICICIFLYMVEREENNVLYIYTKSMFNWTYKEYSNFKTIHVGLSALILFISYLYIKFFENDNKKNIILGSSFCIIGQIIYLYSNVNSNIFYIGLAFSPMGIIIINNLRSIIPMITTTDERMNMFIICGLIEQFGCLTFEFILQSLFVYFRQSIFYVSVINHMIIFLIILIFFNVKT